jgi:hypothetical protein
VIGTAALASTGWWAIVRFTEHWGALPSEVAAPMPGDDLIAAPTLHATRALNIAAPPEEVFPWLVQMGPRRAGWYSYDWIDNRGRPSANELHEEWLHVGPGDSLGAIAGIEFIVAERRDPEVFVIRLPETSPIAFTMAYRLRPWAGHTRVVVRVRAAGPVGTGPIIRFLLGPGDFVMLRRQLFGLRDRTSKDPSTDAPTERQSPQ